MGATGLENIDFQKMIFTFLGGLGLFLFSIKYMGEGLQMSAGDRLRYLLNKYTSSPLLGIVVGILVTALIQSSSGTSVITIGLVGAGLLTINQAIAIIMGANIGTTITTFIISFKITKYSLPILFAGAFLLFFTNRKTLNNLGRILFGFGGIFFALTLMSDAMYPLRYLPEFKELTIKLGNSSLLGVLIGTVLTMLVQASSATISVLQNIYQDGLMPLKSILPVLFGDNIGTTITAIIAVIGASSAAKRIALSHVLFNVIGTIIFLIALTPYTYFVSRAQVVLGLNPKTTIAFAHGAFNMINTMIQFPFIWLLAKIVTKLIPDDKKEEKYEAKYIEKVLIQAPSIALGQVKQEIISMTTIATENLEKSIEYFENHSPKLSLDIEEREEGINHIDHEITQYLTNLSRENLSAKEGEDLSIFLDMCRDVERIGDHAYGILKDVEYQIKKELKFSKEAHDEVRELLNLSVNMINCAIETLRDSNKEKAYEAFDLHNMIYSKEKKIRKNHIKRLNEQKCEIRAGLYYIDLISHFTRVGDHARNIVEKVLDNRL